MLSGCLACVGCAILGLATFANAQSTASISGYVGYNLTLEGDEDSVVYSTEDTRPNAPTTEPDPDVYLNATVFVGEIDIEVDSKSHEARCWRRCTDIHLQTSPPR
jgi:hypothetical protein